MNLVDQRGMCVCVCVCACARVCVDIENLLHVFAHLNTKLYLVVPDEVPALSPNRFLLQTTAGGMELPIEGIHDLQKVLATSERRPILLERRLQDKFLSLWGNVQTCLLELRSRDPDKLMAVSSMVYMHCRGLRVNEVPILSPFTTSYKDVQGYIAKQIDFLDIRLLEKIVMMLNEGEITQVFQQYRLLLGQELPQFVVYCKQKGICNIAPLENQDDVDRPSSSRSDRLPLRVSVSVEEFYMMYILQLKDFFQNQLGIHLQFEGISVGCLVLHFAFSRFLIHELYVFLPSHLPTLKSYKVTALCVPDHFVVNVEKGEIVILEEVRYLICAVRLVWCIIYIL